MPIFNASNLRAGARAVISAWHRGQSVFGGSVAFNPSSLFSSGEKGFVFDLTSPTTLFQNSDGTGAVAMNDDPIGYVSDLSGNGSHATQATAGSRPLWDSTNQCGKFASSLLATPLVDLTGTNKVTLIVCSRFTAYDAQIVIESSANPNTNGGSVSLQQAAGYKITFFARGTSSLGRVTEVYSAPFERVSSYICDTSGATIPDQLSPQVNGVEPTLTNNGTTLGGGNFGNHAFRIGARHGVTFPLIGSIYRIICIGRALTEQEYLNAKNWAGSPIGFFQ